MILGLTIVAIGLIFLLKNLGLISVGIWSVLWPLLIIACGVSLLVKKNKNHKFEEDIRRTFRGE